LYDRNYNEGPFSFTKFDLSQALWNLNQETYRYTRDCFLRCLAFKTYIHSEKLLIIKAKDPHDEDHYALFLCFPTFSNWTKGFIYDMNHNYEVEIYKENYEIKLLEPKKGKIIDNTTIKSPTDCSYYFTIPVLEINELEEFCHKIYGSKSIWTYTSSFAEKTITFQLYHNVLISDIDLKNFIKSVIDYLLQPESGNLQKLWKEKIDKPYELQAFYFLICVCKQLEKKEDQ